MPRAVALAVGLVSLLLLVLFRRALVAPLYLLVSNVLAVGAALGLTTLVFQVFLGADGLIFYVPFAAAVLLVALGSDYNIFSVGYIWEQARRRPLSEALAIAVPRSTRAISVAGPHPRGELRAGSSDPVGSVSTARLRTRGRCGDRRVPGAIRPGAGPDLAGRPGQRMAEQPTCGSTNRSGSRSARRNLNLRMPARFHAQGGRPRMRAFSCGTSCVPFARESMDLN